MFLQPHSQIALEIISMLVWQQTKILNGLSVADADAIIKKYIDLSKMNIVLVGDKEKILPGLQKLGYDIVLLDANGDPVAE